MKALSYQLRDYQQAAVDIALASDNGILVLPTGSGKSLVCAGIVDTLPGRSVILQPSKEILESNYAKIIAFGYRDAAVYSASMGIKEIGKATYATIGSIIKKLELFQECETVIVDECHLVNAKGGQYEQFIKALKPKKLIGMTATPYRLHSCSWGSQLKVLTRTRPRIFRDIIHVTQSDELIEHGFLHDPEFIVSGADELSLLEPNTTGADYSTKSISKYLKATNAVERIFAAVENAIEAGLRHILVFVPSLAESAAVVGGLRTGNITANSVAGNTPKREREARLQDFRSGSIRVMVNVGVLTTGYDFPELDCLISARPTMSLALYYQIIGRSVRPHQSKERVIVYDLVDNFSKFGNPLRLRILSGKTGLHYILSPRGRLTGRWIGEGDEKDDQIDFGKHEGQSLAEIPIDYLRWYIENAKYTPTLHKLAAEIQRREIDWKPSTVMQPSKVEQRSLFEVPA